MTAFKSMRVLFWPGWWYPDRSDPLNGIFIRRHAEAVAPLVDLAVLYVTADPEPHAPAYRLATDKSDAWLTVRAYYRPFPVPFRPWRVFNAWRYFRAARRGIRLLRSCWGGPEVIHLHVSPPWGQIAAMRIYFPGIPYLFTEHWSGYHPRSGEYGGFWRKWLNTRVVRHAFAVTPVSRNLQEIMERHGLRGRYEVVPNAVRTDLFHPSSGQKGNVPFTFLHVSRLVPLKNVAGILRATSALWRQRRDFRLLIVGEGADRSSLETLAKDLGILGDCARFMGRKGETELAEIMRQADCFILFSEYENLPCVVSEALASGLPIIATRVGGIPEQVGEGAGILVDPGDEAGLKDAMSALLEGKARFDRSAIRRFAELSYGYPVVGKSFLLLYQEALARGASRS